MKHFTKTRATDRHVLFHPSLPVAIICINAITFSACVQAKDEKADIITVIGEKIEKKLQDTTTAITVFSGEEAQKDGANSEPNDVATSVPNIVDGGFGSVNIRGISGSGSATGGLVFISGARARVSTNIDGVADAYTGYNYNPAGLWDVEQIDIMRGPQSTNQGGDSIAGAVIVNTNDPSFIFETAARIGAERYDNGDMLYNAAALVSAPIIDDVLAYRLSVEGASGNDFLNYKGETNSVPGEPGDLSSYAVRGKLLWQATNRLKTKVTVSQRKADGAVSNWANFNESYDGDETYTIVDTTSEYRRQDSIVNTVVLDANYTLNEALSSMTILSYNYQKNNFKAYPSESDYQLDDAALTAESRLIFAPTGDKLSMVVGSRVVHRNAAQDYTRYSSRGSVIADGKTDEQRYALYSEVNYKLTDALALSAGGRIQNEKQNRQFTQNDIELVDADIDDTYLLPKIAMTYSLFNNTVVGATYRRGYNAGGMGYISTLSEVYDFEGETVNAFEISAKTDFGNGIAINTALFYNDYSDFQALSNFAIHNVTKAHSTGIELEATEYLGSTELRQSIGYMTSEITEDSAFETGNELPNAPNLNASIGATHYINSDVAIGGDLTYVGEFYSDLENTKQYKVGDYLTLSANASWSIGAFTLATYGKNLTNESVTYWYNASSRGFDRAAIGQSRTIGMSLTYKH